MSQIVLVCVGAVAKYAKQGVGSSHLGPGLHLANVFGQIGYEGGVRIRRNYKLPPGLATHEAVG